MKDLQAQREKLLTDAADCEMIANLATDKEKQAIFRKLATDLRQLAVDLETTIAAKNAI